MHEQQVLFKDCVFSFNGAITANNLEEYLKKDLLSETLGNSFYADRRKITTDHWLGGNPLEKDEKRWESTLALNPALLKIEEYIPWWEIKEIPSTIRANLRRIIESRTTAADQIRIDEENQLIRERINGSYLEKEGYIGLVRNGKCDYVAAKFGSTNNCAEGCPTNILVNSTNDFLDNRYLWYVRDETTGFIRTQIRADAGKQESI